MKLLRPERWMAWLLLGCSPCLGQSDPASSARSIPVPAAPRPGGAAVVRPTNGLPRVISPTNRTARLPANSVAQPTAQPGPSGVFSFDATSKQVELAPGENKTAFVFAITNISPKEVTISYVNTSCGCTAGRLPAYPWKLAPGEGGHLDVSMDLTGKFGTVTKTATIVSSEGSYMLSVSAKIPQTNVAGMGDRSRNLQIAAADRQAVFRNDCARCHVEPTLNKSGRELYETACGICHEAEHRATMVPDLRIRLKNTDRNYWTKWISEGRHGSLMPAFAAKLGGILSEQQVNSLVDYLEDDYKKNPPPSKTVAHASATPASSSPTAEATAAKR